MSVVVFNRHLLAALVLTLSITLVACAPPSNQAGEEPIDGYTYTDDPYRASMPTLSFVDPASITATETPIEGDTLEPGSYVPLISGTQIDTVQWQHDLQEDSPALGIWLDEEAARKLSRWTTDNVGKQLLVVIDDKVIVAPTIREPITDGAVSLAIEERHRAAIEDAIVAK